MVLLCCGRIFFSPWERTAGGRVSSQNLAIYMYSKFTYSRIEKQIHICVTIRQERRQLFYQLHMHTYITRFFLVLFRVAPRSPCSELQKRSCNTVLDWVRIYYFFFDQTMYLYRYFSLEKEFSSPFFLLLIQMHFTRRSAKVYLSKCKTDAWDLSFFFAYVISNTYNFVEIPFCKVEFILFSVLYITQIAVSYTHLTLPTILVV